MGKQAGAVGKAGRAIRRWCARHGVAQAELARRVGCSRGYLTQVVRGFRPSRAFCERLERATKGELRVEDLSVLGDRAA